jgi:Phage tail assembly chaperone proteins, E, or 41 or 14
MAVEGITKERKPKAEPEAEVAADSNAVEINLLKAVQAHGETIKSLSFRRPTGGDLMSMTDWPITIDYNTGRVSPNPPIMGEMMSKLAGVPPSTIRQLEAQDWSTCAHKLMGFFVPLA